jgi:ribosomal protein L22
MSLIKVKDHSELRRDDVTGAIVSVSNNEWYKAKQRKVEETMAKDRNNALRNVEADLQELKLAIAKLTEKKEPWYKRLLARGK